jgi:hypothetical protein
VQWELARQSKKGMPLSDGAAAETIGLKRAVNLHRELKSFGCPEVVIQSGMTTRLVEDLQWLRELWSRAEAVERVRRSRTKGKESAIKA